VADQVSKLWISYKYLNHRWFNCRVLYTIHPFMNFSRWHSTALRRLFSRSLDSKNKNIINKLMTINLWWQWTNITGLLNKMVLFQWNYTFNHTMLPMLLQTLLTSSYAFHSFRKNFFLPVATLHKILSAVILYPPSSESSISLLLCLRVPVKHSIDTECRWKSLSFCSSVHFYFVVILVGRLTLVCPIIQWMQW